MKHTLIIGACAIIIGALGYFFFIREEPIVPVAEAPTVDQTPPANVTPDKAPVTETVTTTPQSEVSPRTVIGSSVDDRDIVAYHFGKGDTEILFVGGIHGGYSWNTSLLAYELIDYLTKNPKAVSDTLRVTVIPVLNPDGLNAVSAVEGPFTSRDIKGTDAEKIRARFNAHTVDLNRNFDCDWKAKGVWQEKEVSGGARAFSEPESQALRDYVNEHTPDSVVVWYSSAGGVYASNCHDGVLPDTKTLVDLYAKASGYPGYESFDYYDITGDMVNWLARMKIPGISVLLTNHTDTEWEKNKKGIEAILAHYSE